jgi:hypothetical protein
MINEYAQRLIVRDANGQALGYFYFEDEPARRQTSMKRLSRNDARADRGELSLAASKRIAG